MKTDNYYLQPKCCENTDLVLGISSIGTSGASVALVHKQPPSTQRNLSIWELMMTKEVGMPPKEDNVAVIRPNVAMGDMTGGWIIAPYENSPVSVISTGGHTDGSPWTAWRFVPYGSDGWYAVQLVSNIKQNLNVAGDGPYEAGGLIYSYKWGDGASNELWKPIPVSY